jgi:hypothetical protein
MSEKRQLPLETEFCAEEEIPEDLDDLYSAEYLLDCADDEARQERLEELKRRIELRAYNIDSDRIADGLLSRGDLSGE